MPLVAIIGGSGLSQLGNMEVTQRRVARTPYGEPSGALTFGRIQGRDAVFLARHGYGHTIAPHEVNYRANIWALKDAGADCVVSVVSVGGIRADIAPGMLMLPDQVIDYTWGRSSTYFEGVGVPVNHIDFTVPFSLQLRKKLLKAAAGCGEKVLDGGVYAATQGPRLESAAEITRLERDGAHIVGMTGMPEAALARELGLCYAAVAVVVNPAAGRGSSAQAIRLADISEVSRGAMARARAILDHLVMLDGD
jgi:5'-deoxy-5'-methylthioadenosine phosphorylase